MITRTVNGKDKRLALYVALPSLIPVVLGFFCGWSLWLLLASIALLGNAYIMCLRLRLADAKSRRPTEGSTEGSTTGPTTEPTTEPTTGPTTGPTTEPIEKRAEESAEELANKAASGARDFVDYLFPKGHKFRRLMVRDLTRVARDSGHHGLARNLRDGL